MLRTFSGWNRQKIRTFGLGSASPRKLDVLIKRKECIVRHCSRIYNLNPQYTFNPCPMRFFENFEKKIYSGMLKLSVAVHSSFPDILMWQLFVHSFWRVMTCRFTQILNFQIKFFVLILIFPVFLRIIAVFVDFNIPLLFWNNFCIDFYIFLMSWGNIEIQMADPRWRI